MPDLLTSPRLRVFSALLLPGLLVLSGAVAQAATDQAAVQQQKLAQLRARIRKVQGSIEQDIQRRGSLQATLRDSEQAIARAAAGLAALDGKVTAARHKLSSLKQQQTAEQHKLEQEKAALAAQIRAAYVEGGNSELQLLLNAKDPASIGRMLGYYEYLNRARATRIAAVRTALAELNRLNAAVETQLQQVSTLRDQQAKALADMQEKRAARKQLLASINHDIHQHSNQITRLRRDEASIQNLLAQLQQVLSDIPPDLEQSRDFARLRGRLIWPVSGTLLHRFGQPLVGRRLPAQGDLIAAPLGTPVRAIAWGRVIYADWMPRFGLLVILDHGHGYLSIYAHNQSLYTQVGDWVQPGQRIATLGDSGGQSQPALYFEIRHKNTSLNPRKWCRGRL